MGRADRCFLGEISGFPLLFSSICRSIYKGYKLGCSIGTVQCHSAQEEEEGKMKMQAVRALGRDLGLSFPVGTTKMEAIRTIQRAEGNFDCYGRAEQAFCDQTGCLFRETCLSLCAQPPRQASAKDAAASRDAYLPLLPQQNEA